MKQIVIKPGALNGRVDVPPSKSAAHRAIICASLARGISVIEPVELSDDISATIRCMKALGARIDLKDKTLIVDGTGIFSPVSAGLDCGESGSTLRFLIPLAAAGGVEADFSGRGRLPQRPIGVFCDCLPAHGVRLETEGGLPLHIRGQLKGGLFEVPGNVSSQFITGLLLSLPLLDSDSEIRLTSPLQSEGYIRMTISAMKRFGVEVIRLSDGWKIPGRQQYKPRNMTVEGDWSQAAFFMTAAALGGSITINNLDPLSEQGDIACMEIYRRFGADVVFSGNSLTVSHNSLHGIEINAEQIPDMVPALAVTAALCEGETVIRGAARLRIKECDRLAAIAEGLSRLGADIRETDDGLTIHGVPALHGGNVEGYNDHRIVMALAVAGVRCSGNITITDPDSINKSYPGFFGDLRSLGGCADVVMG